MTNLRRIALLHFGVLALLFALQFILPAYHRGNLARIMVLASYAIGFNIAFGYTGLLSLGHSSSLGPRISKFCIKKLINSFGRIQ